MKKFKTGDPILVIGQICKIRTCIGLFGYITQSSGKEFSLKLLTHPTLEDDWDRKREEQGDNTWTATAKRKDIRPLTDPEQIARVERLKSNDNFPHKKEIDPWISEMTKKLFSPKSREERRKKEEDIERETQRIGDVFPLKGKIRRGDKSDYTCYADIAGSEDELRGYAHRGPKDCTVTELARWRQALEVQKQASFWSGREEVRDLVLELDLDPMIEQHASALYFNEGRVYAPKGTLRKKTIPLWNQGAQILQIQDMEDEDTCWASYKTGEPAGYLITYAFRRKLPEP